MSKNVSRALRTAAILIASTMSSLAVNGPAHGQTRIVERQTSARPPLESAANALGMERGVRREMTAINAIYFIGKGTRSVRGEGGYADRKVSRAVFSMSYHIPAIRMDVDTGTKAKPQRTIEVANGAIAWNESEPGIGATPTRERAVDRLQQAWLTPHGAVRALVDARAKDAKAVTIAEREGRTVFSMNFQGGPFEVIVDSTWRPERVRWTLEGHTTEAQFSKYKDWEILDVYFPQRIVQRVDGRVTLDLTVSEFRSNPYVVFPVPAVLRTAK